MFCLLEYEYFLYLFAMKNNYSKLHVFIDMTYFLLKLEIIIYTIDQIRLILSINL